jgi:hypothetical protein
MAGNKYISWDAANKRKKEVAGQQTSAGAADANKIPALNASGVLDPTLLPPGVGATTQLVQASENIASGAEVNLYDIGGNVLRARNAIATAYATKSDGFVLAAVLSGANATVYFNEKNSAKTGLDVGEIYFLSDTTPGGVTLTPPTAAGSIVQSIGKAMSATELTVDIDESPLELS